MWGVVVYLVCVAGISAFADSAPSAKTTDSRIVSGWEASEGQFPYMLYVRGVTHNGDIGFCGGSIIHSRWGLSSGRCTANRAHLIISGGMVNLNRPRFLFETSTVVTAPGFVDSLHQITQAHDIAVIGFNRDLTFDQYVQPIRIQSSADSRRDYTGVRMTTAGWGTVWTWGETVENLNWVHLQGEAIMYNPIFPVPIMDSLQGVSNFVCLLMHNSNWLVQETTVCAGPYNVTSQSICSGDSGVPLVAVDTDGRLTQVGVGSFVASWGCHVGFPGGFTRPGFYHDYIRQTTGINFDWQTRTNADDVGTIEVAASANEENVKIAEDPGTDRKMLLLD